MQKEASFLKNLNIDAFGPPSGYRRFLGWGGKRIRKEGGL